MVLEGWEGGAREKEERREREREEEEEKEEKRSTSRSLPPPLSPPPAGGSDSMRIFFFACFAVDSPSHELPPIEHGHAHACKVEGLRKREGKRSKRREKFEIEFGPKSDDFFLFRAQAAAERKGTRASLPLRRAEQQSRRSS